MPVKQGVKTAQIAEKLTRKLKANSERYSDVSLYYDHGESDKKEVCQPTAYMGKRYGSDATLGGADIVLVKDGRVFCVIEVEESQTRPKAILGDIFSLVLSERMRIQEISYPIRDAVLIVAMIVPDKGMQENKYLRLQRHIKKYIDALRETGASLSVEKVRVVPSLADDLVRRVERLIRLEVGKAL